MKETCRRNWWRINYMGKYVAELGGGLRASSPATEHNPPVQDVGF